MRLPFSSVRVGSLMSLVWGVLILVCVVMFGEMQGIVDLVLGTLLLATLAILGFSIAVL